VNWEAVGALAELGGALGIIVTLAYLAVQLRQNSALLSASVSNATREASNEVASLLASDREALRVFWSGLEDRNALESLDQQQFDAILTMWFEAMVQSYHHADRATLDRFNWGLTQLGVKQWWNIYAATQPEDFQSYVNDQLQAVPPAV
jgi:hypothetical protein